jgi:ATP-dependent RNA helicase DeaD
MKTFSELGLEGPLMKAIEKAGFETPTEIQALSIPLILEGKDIIATSSTGSGKTLAFGLGVLPQLEQGVGIQTLILCPTRELAEQIVIVLRDFAKPLGLRTVPIYGGVSMNPQVNALRSADIVVATPGRLLDHMSRNSIDLSVVRFAILDEADRMLDMGFLPDVSKILQACPKHRQTLLYTATLPLEVSDLAARFMKSPEKLKAGVYVDPKKLKQVYYDVQGSMKFSLLVHLLKQERDGLVMVFCNSRKYVDSIEKGLKNQKIEAMAIHGGLTQASRQKVLNRFHKGHAFVLVCTDVAARGLDIPNVTHVYNYDIPNDSKQYMHRVGRTARAGEEGLAVNLISSRDYDNFGRVLQDNDIKVEKLERPYIDRVDLPTNGGRGEGRGDSRGGRDGQRGGQGNYNRGGPRGQGAPRRSGGRPSTRPRSSERSEGSPRGSQSGYGSDAPRPNRSRPSWNNHVRH